MKRYGDNLPSSKIFDDELNHEHGRDVRVIFGGCGVRFSTFSQPPRFAPKRKKFDLWSVLGFRKEKSKEEIA